MPDTALEATPVLAGTSLTFGDSIVRSREDLALVSVALPQGGEEKLRDAFARAWDLDLPTSTQSTGDNVRRVLRTAPDQMMLIFPHATPDAEPHVRKALGATAYTTDQTDAWTILEISGPDAIAALERLCPLDLADQSFPIGAAARTVMEHMGAIIVRTGDHAYLLLSASSSARSFLHAVEVSFANTAAGL